MRHWFALAVALTAASAGASAQPAGDLAGESVRQLAREGDEAFRVGDFTTALDKFERAYSVVEVPTIGLFYARSLEKLGRLVEASQQYAAVTRLSLPSQKRELHEKAQQDAVAELALLRPRIPRIVIVATPAPDSALSIDGRAVTTEQLAKEIALDPGPHRVEMVAGTRVARREITLAEREAKQVDIALDPEPAPPRPLASPTKTEPVARAAPTMKAGTVAGPRALAVTGWIGVGIGAAGLAMGAIAGGMAVSQNDELDQTSCVDDICKPSARDDVESYMRNRTISVAGFIVGGIAAGAGATLLIIDVVTASTDAPSVKGWLGPEGAGVRGVF